MDFKKDLYFSAAKPIFDKRALFHDDSKDYIIPFEPAKYSEVTLRFRTKAENVDHVFVIINNERQLMSYAHTIGEFDYYEYTYQLSAELIVYYFEVVSGAIKCFYDTRGVIRHADANFGFKLSPGYKTPDWIKGAVMYQIYVDRFYNGDKTNDVETNEYYYIGDKSVRVTDWNKYPDKMGVREFYGGDLQGVIDKLDYLEDLGIEAIYFNPLFVSPSNHKYDSQDYDYIDPHIGKIVNDKGDLLKDGETENRLATKYINRVTNKENLEASNLLFAHLVEECHKRNIKVIIDGVFNHCGSFNKWMDRERIYENAQGYEKGAYVSKDSPYRSYFSFHDNSDGKWPYNNTYDGWWGHDTLPKLNYEGSQKLYDYILYIAKKWLSPPYNVDGWRLDVAADLAHSPEFNHKFWRDFRRVVKQVNPEAVIIAEHYGDPWEWLQGDQWDTIMNYDAFMEPLTWFLTGMDKHSDDFRPDMLGNADALINSLRNAKTSIMSPARHTSMNQLSNHDHSRFLSRTNHVVGRVQDKGPEAANRDVSLAVMREAVLMQMSWMGAPTIYYGDEAGVCGFTDPDNRRTYPWGQENQELINFHKDMIKIRKQHEELREGSTYILYADYNVMAYGRFLVGSQCVVVVNNNDTEKEIKLNIYEIGTPRDASMNRLIFTYEDGYTTAGSIYPIINGKIEIKLPPHSAVILKAYDDE